MFRMFLILITAVFFTSPAQASGLWALSGQIILSGPTIGTVPVSVPITSVADGHYFSETSCESALNRLIYAPVIRATSTSVGLYYTEFTKEGEVLVGKPGTELKFNPLANVTKTVMADCIPIGQ